MLKIRKASIKDVPEIVDVNIKSWESTYFNLLPENVVLYPRIKRENIIKQYTNYLIQYDNFIVMEYGNKIIGFLIYRNDKFESLYLLKEYQGLGYGTKIFKYGMELLKRNGYKKMYLNVVVGNNNAIKFYKKFGGEIIDRHTLNVMGEDIDEYEMIFELL